MYYAAESNIKPHIYNGNRKLRRTDGIFPTTTMLLHERIVGWHRKRRIPVRYVDKTNNLNSYLIDPKYLDNGEVVLPKELPEPVTKSVPRVPIYQYSKITRDSGQLGYAESGPLTQVMSRLFSAIGLGITAMSTELSARYQAWKKPKPTTHYAVNEGVLPWWKHRIKVFTAALLTGGLIVAAATIDTTTSLKPTPVSANPSTDTSQKITSETPAHASSVPVANPSGQIGTSPSSSTAAQTSLPATPTSTLPYQQPVTASTSQTTQQTTTNTATSPTATSTPTTTTSPTPAPSTPITQPLAPIIDPVTGLTNNVLSSQITVNAPVSTSVTAQPLVQLSQ